MAIINKTFAQIFVLILFTTFANAQLLTNLKLFPLPGLLSCATGPNPATDVSIGVSDCTSAPCKFIIGKPYTFSVYARSAVNTASTPFTVTAAFPGLGSYTFITGDGCDVLALGYCPVATGYLYLADLTYTVPSYSPTGYAVIEISVKDDSNNVIICEQFFGLVAVN